MHCTLTFYQHIVALKEVSFVIMVMPDSSHLAALNSHIITFSVNQEIWNEPQITEVKNKNKKKQTCNL